MRDFQGANIRSFFSYGKYFDEKTEYIASVSEEYNNKVEESHKEDKAIQKKISHSHSLIRLMIVVAAAVVLIVILPHFLPKKRIKRRRKGKAFSMEAILWRKAIRKCSCVI